MAYFRYISMILGVLFIAGAVLAQTVAGAGIHDDRTGFFTYGGCSAGNQSPAYYGTVTFCSPSQTVDFSFYGDEFAIYATRNGAAGDVQICIDANCSVSSAYSPVAVYGEWVRFYNLSLAQHNVTITALSGFFYFDALYVAPVEAGGGGANDQIHQINVNVTIAEATPEVTPEMTPETTPEATPELYRQFTYEDDSGATYEARVSYEVTAGDLLVSMVVFALFVIAFITLGVKLWQK